MGERRDRCQYGKIRLPSGGWALIEFDISRALKAGKKV
jgi:hypothetical protein